MNLRARILAYLEAGQATAAALADVLGAAPESVSYQLKRLVAEDAVTAHPIAASPSCPKGPITVYRLSYLQRQAAGQAANQ